MLRIHTFIFSLPYRLLQRAHHKGLVRDVRLRTRNIKFQTWEQMLNIQKKKTKQIKTSAPKSKLITFTQLSLHNKRLISLPVSFVIITNCMLQTNESCVADFVRHYLIISNRKHTSNVSCYFSRAGSTVGSVAWHLSKRLQSILVN